MNSLQIRAGNTPYGALVETFLGRVFPANIENKGQLLDNLAAAFVATASLRNGPAPNPESLVELRRRITWWTAKDQPIAVLVPWGSKKTVNGRSVDIAEVFALRQLEALNERVQRIYAPGLLINLAIEDLGGLYTWQDEGESTVTWSNAYVVDVVNLVRVLGLTPRVVAVRESQLISAQTFNAHADLMTPVLYRVLTGQQDLSELTSLGWQGDVNAVMVEWYLAQYEKTYPGTTREQKQMKLARYLSQSFTRYALGIKTAYQSWGRNYVQVNFPSPVPGIPEGLGSGRLYYRTMSAKFARTHMPPWRAKGYLAIDNANSVTPKLASWNDTENVYNPLSVEFIRPGNDQFVGDSIKVDADFCIREGGE